MDDVYNDEERQSAKEEAIIMALNLPVPAALSRAGLDMYLIKADGSKELLVTGSNYDVLWHETLDAMKAWKRWRSWLDELKVFF